jgi:alpha-ketoglutaric semialdehyde dehydrogenase
VNALDDHGSSPTGPPARAALLLVDLQRDYLKLGGLEPSSEATVARARRLLQGFRDRELPVIHAWTTVSRTDDRRMRHWRSRGLWRCEEGTDGHRPAAGLEPCAGEEVVHKHGFDPFADGELTRTLKVLGVERLAIAGIHLHACVREAALGAHASEQLREVWVIEDAVTSDDPVHAALTRRYLQDRDVRFLAVNQALACLDEEQHGEAPEEVRERVGEIARRIRAAAGPWRKLEASSRAQVLERAAELLEPQAQSLARAMAEDIGKPIRYGEMEVSRAAQMLRAIARRLSTSTEQQLGLDTQRLPSDIEVRGRPLGVVAVITPWNNPVYIPLGKLAAALAYGNGVLWKPAPAAQRISERLAAILLDAGLPEHLLGLVAGTRMQALMAMSDQAVDAVTVTGSSLAGFAAQEVCASRRIPLQAELGGNNAALVWSDADLELAATEIAAGAFALAGQRCTANRRLIVERSRQAELLELLIAETAALKWGDPLDRATSIGPMVGVEQRDRLAEMIARSGLEPIVPHGRAAVAGVQGAWYPPTILTCQDPTHELVQRETFGPLLVLQPADSWADAVDLLNGVEQGLVAALFTSSAEVSERFLDQAEAGILKLNRSTADAEVDVPFGGWKHSAIGPPEHGSFDRNFYTRPQTVYR